MDNHITQEALVRPVLCWGRGLLCRSCSISRAHPDLNLSRWRLFSEPHSEDRDNQMYLVVIVMLCGFSALVIKDSLSQRLSLSQGSARKDLLACSLLCFRTLPRSERSMTCHLGDRAKGETGKEATVFL